MTPVNPLSLVGLMLTLAGLLGSFFYLQLSQWLRDILALRQKTQLNIAGGEEAQRRAIVECRVELRRLATWHSYVVNLVVIAFVVFVLVLGLRMIEAASSDPMYGFVHLAIVVFLAVFLVLSAGLLFLGSSNAREVAKLLNPADPGSS
jgi:amino acid transporter